MLRCIQEIHVDDFVQAESSRYTRVCNEMDLIAFQNINMFSSKKRMNLDVLGYTTSVLYEIKKMMPTVDDVGGDDEIAIAMFTDPLMIVINKEVNYLSRQLDRINKSIDHLLLVTQRTIPYNHQDKADIANIASALRPVSWDIGNSSPILFQWVNELKTNADFFNHWIRRGKPKIYICSAFHYIRIFTSAIMKRISKTKNAPVSDIIIEATILDQEPEQIPEDSFLVTGVGLFGCKWTEDGLVGVHRDATRIPYALFTPLTLQEAAEKTDLIQIPIFNSRNSVSLSDYVQENIYSGSLYIHAKKENLYQLRICGAAFLIM